MNAYIYPGYVWALRHHEHEVEVDQVCAAADADDAALQVCLRLPNGLERRQDLWVLGKERVRRFSKTLTDRQVDSYQTDKQDKDTNKLTKILRKKKTNER